MGGLCMRNRNLASEAATPIKKNSLNSKISPDVSLKANPQAFSQKRKYSKTAEDITEDSNKTSLLKASKKSWRSKRTMKVKETAKVVERRNSEGEKIINHYTLVRQIGEGSFGKVKLAVRRFIDIEQFFAIKIFRAGCLNARKINFNEKGEIKISDPLADVKKEIAIMKKLNHLNVIRLYEVIEDPEKEKFYMIMEYAVQGPLVTWIESSKRFISTHSLVLTEDYLRKIFRDCMKGLHYIHQNGIIHRDIKPQNILLDGDGVAKLADFGVSSMFFGSDDKLKNVAGTYQFMSPEALSSKDKKGFSGKAADIWSIGVTFYSFFFLELPFYANSISGIIDCVLTKKLKFPKEKICSEEFKALLSGMLNKDPKKRLTLEKIIEYPWVNDGFPNLASEIKTENAVVIDEEDMANALLSIERVVFLKQIIKKWKSNIEAKKVRCFPAGPNPLNVYPLEESKILQ